MYMYTRVYIVYHKYSVCYHVAISKCTFIMQQMCIKSAGGRGRGRQNVRTEKQYMARCKGFAAGRPRSFRRPRDSRRARGRRVLPSCGWGRRTVSGAESDLCAPLTPRARGKQGHLSIRGPAIRGIVVAPGKGKSALYVHVRTATSDRHERVLFRSGSVTELTETALLPLRRAYYCLVLLLVLVLLIWLLLSLLSLLFVLLLLLLSLLVLLLSLSLSLSSLLLSLLFRQGELAGFSGLHAVTDAGFASLQAQTL